MKLTIFFLFVFAIWKTHCALRQCLESEVTTVMTECNEITNEKYRFTVATTDCEAPEAHFGIACDKVCEPGTFLDLEGDKNCHKCPKGSYSLGSGAMITSWPENDSDMASLPLGFAIDYNYISLSSTYCNGSSWTPKGDFIVSNSDHCFVRLMYVADMKLPGYVEFEYRYTDPALHFHFYVVDENCHEPRESSIYPAKTGNEKWGKIKVPLAPGINKLYWRTYAVTYGENATTEASKRVKPVLLKSVYINGVAYSTECTKCPPGFFQDQEGASSCSPCLPGSYSTESGSTACKPCSTDSQYSPYAATKCLTRPKCTKDDYYSYHAPCKNGMTLQTYEWITPKICRGDMEGESGAAQLPESNQYQTCPVCNPGMFKNSSDDSCEFCPKDFYSNGTTACVKCPAKHKAVPAYVFEYWDENPPNTIMYCYSVSGEGCPKEEDGNGWSYSNDAIATNLGNADDSIVVLEIDVPNGFDSEAQWVGGKFVPVGYVKFVFEMDCPSNGNCTMFFGQDNGVDFQTVNIWDGPHAKNEYVHPVLDNQPQKFLWAFQKASHPELENASNKYLRSQLKLHSITITGTIDGGAPECEPCDNVQNQQMPRSFIPSGLASKCEPCPKGQFYAAELNRCVACPADFIVNPLGTSEDKHCLKCGPGLTSQRGVNCRSDCKFNLADGRQVDLSTLNKRRMSLKSRPHFTDSGFESFKLYNFSLCGSLETGSGLAYCSANVSRISHDFFNASDDQSTGDEERSRKYGFVCRSDLYPPSGDWNEYFTEYPAVLGEELVAVTSNRSYLNWSIQTTDENSDTFDINFYYISFQPTYACPKGRFVILTLRCNPWASDQEEGQVQVDPDNPEGTLDGCDYNFLWVSKYACPVCDASYDYDEILGECHFGRQQVRYTWKNDKRICRDGELPRSLSRKCTFFTRELQISIALAVFIVILLTIVSSYYWKKTQKLEYKYQKLVQSSNKDGTTKFAEAPSCGLSEDEEDDDDEVNFYGNGGSDKRSMLGKLRLKNGKALYRDQGSDDEAHVKLSTGGRFQDDLDAVNSRI